MLVLLQKWGLQFEKDRDILPLFYDVYNALKQKGNTFPDPPVESPPQRREQEQPAKVAPPQRG